MASIRLRGPQQWEAQIRKRGWPTQTRTFKTKAEAKCWAAVIESEMARSVFVDRSEAERTTFGDLLRRYLSEVTPLKKGAEPEGYRIDALLRDGLASVRVASLSGRLLAEWRDRRLMEVSGSTVNRDLSLISHVLNTARREWGLPIDNPIAAIRRPQNNRPRDQRVQSDAEALLLAALEVKGKDPQGRFTGPQNIWIKPIAILAIETAMRRSELLSLCWDDVHLAERYVRLHDTKNGCSRDVPLSTRARTVLSELPRHISGRVFPISANALKQAFKRAVRRAELGDVHFHDLRHEATTRIAGKLSNVLELSAVTGHKTLSMLKRYYHRPTGKPSSTSSG